MSYIQFKLTNNEEIICEVLDEPEGEDVNLVIRKAMVIIKTEDIANNMRYYSFRPWMTYQLKRDYMQLLNYTHIIGEAKPDEQLLEQYLKSIDLEMAENGHDDVDETNKDSIQRLLKAVKSLKDGYSDSDSLDKKIISFPNKDKMH